MRMRSLLHANFLNLIDLRNVKLLSFGDDEEATDQAEPVNFKKKGIVRPDCV